MSPKRYKGWEVAFTCSQADSQGKKIELKPTRIAADGNEEYGLTCYLEPGYEALVTVYMYNPENLPERPGGSAPLGIDYWTASQGEHIEAVRRGLVGWSLTNSVPHRDSLKSLIPLGHVTGKKVFSQTGEDTTR